MNSDSLWSVWDDSRQSDTSRLLALKVLPFGTIIDSAHVLKRSLDSMQVGNEAIELHTTMYRLVAVAFSYQFEYEISEQMLDMVLSTAEQNNLLEEIASAYHSRGFVFKKQRKYIQAEKAYQTSLDLREQLGLKNKMADTYNSLGVLYITQKNAAAALDNFHRGALLCEEIGSKLGMARGYQNIGLIYLEQNVYDKALEYLLKSLQLYEELDALVQISISYNNIGIIYKNMGEYELALDYYQKGLNISEELGDKSNMAFLYINIGNIHDKKGNYVLALDAFSESLRMGLELGNQRRISGSKNGLGTIYNKLKKYDLAILNCESSYTISEDIEDLEELKNSCGCLMDAYEKKGNISMAYKYQREYFMLKDTLRTLENAQEVTRIGMNYEFDKQRLADSLNMEEDKLKAALAYQDKIAQEKAERNMFMYIGLGILILAGGLFSRLRYVRSTNRALQEKNILIEREKKRAEESERSKELFFSNVSHEFRTPLTLILGPLDKIIPTIEDENLKDDLSIIKRNATRLQSMINELLNLYKLESGKIKLQAAEEDIVSFLSSYLHSFESLAQRKKIKLGFKSEFKTYPIFFDKEKIEKIITNLLSNAFKFTDEGGEIILSISAKSSSSGDKPGIVISVSDTGIGIPQDNIGHVFDRFYMVDDSLTRNHEGTGIGLALTKELIELHYGNIWVESTVGKGSTFSFFLPSGQEHLKPAEILKEVDPKDIEDDSETELPEVVRQIDENGEDDEKGLPILLIVEDNKDMRKYIRGYLDEEYKIIEAENGEEGLSKAIEHIPDLMLSDVMMPKMDGRELCTRLKSDERTSHIPVVMLTARATVEEKIEGLEIGADAYIAKPFNAKELQAIIKNLIEQRKKLRERFIKNLGAGIQLAESEITSMDQQFMKKVLEVVEEHIADADFSVEIFSQEMAMSRVQLHRKLKALTGQSANRFLRTLRLKRAAELLSNKGVNVTEAAYDTGFNNMSYFSKCFHEQFGMSPSEYVKQA